MSIVNLFQLFSTENKWVSISSYNYWYVNTATHGFLFLEETLADF